MDKTKILKWAGIVGVIAGAICLYFAGVAEAAVTAIIGAVFVLIGLVMAIFRS